MKIKLTSVYVDDQDKALRFYSEVLGFVKKTDFSQGPFRWRRFLPPLVIRPVDRRGRRRGTHLLP